MRAAEKYSDEPCFCTLLQQLRRNVRHLRRELGLTLQEAAERAEIDWRHWQKIEAGENNATLATLSRVADSLGAEPNELLGPELPPVRGKPAPRQKRRTKKRT